MDQKIVWNMAVEILQLIIIHTAFLVSLSTFFWFYSLQPYLFASVSLLPLTLFPAATASFFIKNLLLTLCTPCLAANSWATDNPEILKSLSHCWSF